MSVFDEAKALLSDPEQLRSLAQGVFDPIDADGSGFIDQNELFNAMSKAASAANAPAPTEQQVAAAITEADTNQDGRVAFEEYLGLLRRTLISVIEAEEQQTIPTSELKAEQALYEEDGTREAEALYDEGSLGADAAWEEDKHGAETAYADDYPGSEAAFEEGHQEPHESDIPGSKAAFEEGHQGAEGTTEEGAVGADHQLALEEQTPEVTIHKQRSPAGEERHQKHVEMFDKYLQVTGLKMAFQIIFSEVISKKVEPSSAFAYTATRLRQIGKEVAPHLPEDLTAGIVEGNSLH
jgi:hypothetical protein